MLHGLTNEFLYSAKRIITYWDTPKGIFEWAGTGFFIEKDDDIYLITNRHIAELAYSKPEHAGATLIKFLIEGYEYAEVGKLPFQYTTIIIENAGQFIFHPNKYNDIACLKNPKCDLLISNSSTISLPIDYNMIATKEEIDTQLTVCDSIAYPGFPQWYDKKNSTPIFRMGTIASDPRVGYACEITDPDADRVAYEGFSSAGASGSPVFAIQRGFSTGKGIETPDGFYRRVMLVGINAGHFSDTDDRHSGISFFYKSSSILEIIEACDKI